MKNFLRSYPRLPRLAGQPCVVLYDNLKSAVLKRRGNEVHFNPRLLELCAHYYFVARPARSAPANQGRGA
jgi:hypothetical protein